MKKTIVTTGAMIAALVIMVATHGPLSAQDGADDSDDLDQIKSELSSKTVSFEFKDTQFREVINRIRQQVSFNIIIADKVDQSLGQGGEDANQGNNQAGGGANNGFGGNDDGNSGGFGNSDSGNNSGGFGNSGSSDSGGGFGNSGGDNSSGGFGNNNSGGSDDSSGGFGNNSGGGGGGFGNTDDSSSGGFGSNDSGGGGFGSSGGSSGDSGFGTSGGSSGFGNAGGAGGAAGGNQLANIDDKVTIKLDNVTIMRALKLILDQKNLTAVFKLGAVHIVPKNQAEKYNIQFYDVRDLQYKLKDFESQMTRFHQGGGYTGNDSGKSGSDTSKEFLNKNMFGGDGGGDNKEIITNEKEFMKLIKSNVGSKQDWQGKANMRMTNGILVVNQTKDVHDDIDFLINRLRQFK